MTPSIQEHAPHDNTVLQGDCIARMRAMPNRSIDFILTDPPYLVGYKSRDGRSIENDRNADWLKPAFAEMYRVLKPNSFCVSFYGWSKAHLFLDAWREAGFRVCGHIVFRKRYASRSTFLRAQHEQAYLLVKGRPSMPEVPIPDVIEFPYTGNRLHPTQKPVAALAPLIACFTQPDDMVLDPFCGSGSTLIAASQLGRKFIGIELDSDYANAATQRVYAAKSHPRSK